MAYSVHNFESKSKLYASQLNEMDQQIASNDSDLRNLKPSDLNGVVKSGNEHLMVHEARIEYYSANTSAWRGLHEYQFPVTQGDKLYFIADDVHTSSQTQCVAVTLYDAGNAQIGYVWLDGTVGTILPYVINHNGAASVKISIYLASIAPSAGETYYIDNLYILKNSDNPDDFSEYSFDNKFKVGTENIKEGVIPPEFSPIPNAILSEIDDTKQKLLTSYVNGRVSYIFLTDLHFENYAENEAAIKNTIRYAVKLANESDIDFICLGGDYIDNATTKAEAQNRYNQMFSLFGGCRKPVIAVRGNHDNAVTEGLNVGELFSLTQSVVNNSRFVYDDSVVDGMYFYLDIPSRKTRVVCVDSWSGNGYANEQLKFIADKALTKTDGWNYVFVSHVPPLEKYETDGMDQRWSWGCGTWNGFQLNDLITAFNGGESITDSVYGAKNFSGNTSKVICINFGHTHASHIEYDEELKTFCVSTGCALSNGGQGVFNDSTILRDDNQTTENRRYMNLDNPNKYLFDVISVSRNRINRIRFGNGIDKEISV